MKGDTQANAPSNISSAVECGLEMASHAAIIDKLALEKEIEKLEVALNSVTDLLQIANPLGEGRRKRKATDHDVTAGHLKARRSSHIQ